MNREAALYEVLEVSPRASAVVIRAAYRHLAQCNHPDKNPGSSAASDKLVQINHAYSVLSDPEKRRRYDQTLALQEHPKERRGTGSAKPSAKDKNANQPVVRAFVLRPLV